MTVGRLTAATREMQRGTVAANEVKIIFRAAPDAVLPHAMAIDLATGDIILPAGIDFEAVSGPVLTDDDGQQRYRLISVPVQALVHLPDFEDLPGDVETVTIRVNDVDEAPVIDLSSQTFGATSGNAAHMEITASTAATAPAKTFQLTGTDQDGDAVSFRLAAEAASHDNARNDNDRVFINAQGQIVFRTGMFDFEEARIENAGQPEERRYFLIQAQALSTGSSGAEQTSPVTDIRIYIEDDGVAVAASAAVHSTQTGTVRRVGPDISLFMDSISFTVPVTHDINGDLKLFMTEGAVRKQIGVLVQNQDGSWRFAPPPAGNDPVTFKFGEVIVNAATPHFQVYHETGSPFERLRPDQRHQLQVEFQVEDQHGRLSTAQTVHIRQVIGLEDRPAIITYRPDGLMAPGEVITPDDPKTLLVNEEVTRKRPWSWWADEDVWTADDMDLGSAGSPAYRWINRLKDKAQVIRQPLDENTVWRFLAIDPDGVFLEGANGYQAGAGGVLTPATITNFISNHVQLLNRVFWYQTTTVRVGGHDRTGFVPSETELVPAAEVNKFEITYARQADGVTPLTVRYPGQWADQNSGAGIEIPVLELRLRPGEALDINKSYYVNIRVTDPAILFSPSVAYVERVVRVTIHDARPTNFEIQTVVRSLDETASTDRTLVARLIVTDPDTDPRLRQHRFTLEGYHDVFEVDGTDLYLKAGVTLDYEAFLNFRVPIRLEGTDLRAFYHLGVNDLPEDPITVRATAVVPVPENAAVGLRVASLSSHSRESGIIAYFLLAEPSDYFEVVNDPFHPRQQRTGYVRLKAEIDYDALPQDQKIQTIKVQARYSKQGVTIASENLEVAIAITNVDDNGPTFDMVRRSLNRDEVHGVNAPQDSRSFTLPEFDADGDRITYIKALSPVGTDNDNALVSITGNTITFAAGIFDHERDGVRVDPVTREQYFLIDLTASSTGTTGQTQNAPKTSTQSWRFVITDINDIQPRFLHLPPPSIDVPHTVPFGAKENARILSDRSAWDPASIDDVPGITVRYKLIAPADNLRLTRPAGDLSHLSIDPVTGEIWFRSQPEPGRRYDMRIVIESEANGHVMTSTPIGFRVDVADIQSSGAMPPPPTPVFDPRAHRQVADEVNGLADVAGRRSITVPNVDAQGNRVTFTLAASTAGNDNEYVTIRGNIVTFAAGIFDHERADVRVDRLTGEHFYQIDVMASIGGAPVVPAQLRFVINDINDVVPRLDQSDSARDIPPGRIETDYDIAHGARVDAAHLLIRNMPRIITDDAPGVTGFYRLVPRPGHESDISSFAINPATGDVWFAKQPTPGKEYRFNMTFESRADESRAGDMVIQGHEEDVEDLGFLVAVAPRPSSPSPPATNPTPPTSPVSQSMLGTVSHVIDTPYPTSGLSTPPPRTGLMHFTKAYSAPQGQDFGYTLGVTHGMFVAIPEGTGLQNLPHDIAYGRGEIFNLHFGERDVSVRPHNPPKSFFTTDISGPGSNIADPTVEHIWGWQESERIWFADGGRKLTLGGASGTIHARMENVGGFGALGGSAGQRNDTVLQDGSGAIYAVIYDYTIQQDDLADGLTLAWV